MRLQDTFYPENLEIVKFKISCRPDFQRLDNCWDVFANPFATSNNSRVVCILPTLDIN